ncbi:unnamed protein product [Larinioides sclopetarius]|uniref:Uncharacterized protein n=1 Tax=Larinioides sclopetarius TaxID=280406 RepID=A0AAV2AQC6_9ARAC
MRSMPQSFDSKR